ncbi:conserved hypothetical protein [Vibrio nigripulchritudo SO65]|uniref:hypothetical protein n=1 Tax=Vibrio nigripulchritudo TaxID=28173 RepID=UPI0003B222AD|nr:hypothetical protein [Vibrio nigripulchritudo]CCN38659.1 conserved hypothetical protein [Vibrio nigripulchritudo AM115]CCN44968.1 conserved hypothetical protein [Vibrio nigripulchritudo FTn2]CCN79726.1 conserved hypothetical protein [Vibrio nigripulchritudo SO65]
MASVTVYLQENLPSLSLQKADTTSDQLDTSSVMRFGNSLLSKAKKATSDLSAAANFADIHVAPSIADSVLNEAIGNFAISNDKIKPSSIIGILDSTLLGNVKDGVLFTAKGIYYKKHFSDSVFIEFNDIENVTLTGGDESDGKSALLHLKDGSCKTLSLIADCNVEQLARILSTCSSEFSEYQEENVLVALNDMHEEVRVAYTKIVINMAYYDDNEVDADELAEILRLMTRLEFSSNSRLEIRSYLSSSGALEKTQSLVESLSLLCTPTELKALMVSLCKDLIHLKTVSSKHEKDKEHVVTSDFSFFNDHKHLFDVSSETIELICAAIKMDFKLLNEDTTNEQVEAEMKKLAAKAAAVGTPIAAIYLSGSVIGLSAAGMTSGLAALGMGGVLGLSSMATGIGIVVLIGVGTYAGVKMITGADEQNSNKRRELMLIAVNKQTQITISQLMEDIAYITDKLNQTILGHEDTKALAGKLMATLKQLTSAGQVLNKSAQDTEKATLRTRVPAIIDRGKVESLTSDYTASTIRDFILDCYELQESNAGKLRSHLSIKDLDSLSAAIEKIGYYNLTDIVAGTASHKASQAKSAIKGMFQ